MFIMEHLKNYIRKQNKAKFEAVTSGQVSETSG